MVTKVTRESELEILPYKQAGVNAGAGIDRHRYNRDNRTMIENDDERARRILTTLDKIPDRPPSRHSHTWFVVLTTLVLLAAICLVVLRNRTRFAFLYQHVTHPDSLVEPVPE